MNSKCAAIACRSADIVGLASLVSMEMNELVALDVGTVKGLILMLVIRKRKLSVAACDALLDLSTTLIGIQSIPISIYDGKKMVPASSILVSLYNEDGSSIACARIAFKEDGHSVSLLHTAITLINTCNIEQLEKIPSKLSEKFLDYMKSLWEKVHNQMLLGNAWMSFQERDLNLSNVTVNNLAESIFSFSINTSEFVIPLPSVKHAFNAMDIMKCEEAFKEGYTIALSFGVQVLQLLQMLTSIYLTPPNSQGWDRYCDDHCVFVCQLFGTKQWTIYSQPNLQLPRLYDPLDREQCFVEENSLAGYRKFLLREGDILYIPRGFPHEACTHDGGSSDLARFSLRHIWY
ncbi:hypothetical protein H0E87_013215 [Populus deltoides]|uniref:Bifunctional lysine-specific demethylase and histidyl-hydroxylase n=1 Tax=Populus deltoides TaxID=3696 RepID=A0A8T2YM43_POPDE|nr:hypothetical protein H0E87_013215 [Populus deltoides]